MAARTATAPPARRCGGRTARCGARSCCPCSEVRRCREAPRARPQPRRALLSVCIVVCRLDAGRRAWRCRPSTRETLQRLPKAAMAVHVSHASRDSHRRRFRPARKGQTFASPTWHCRTIPPYQAVGAVRAPHFLFSDPVFERLPRSCATVGVRLPHARWAVCRARLTNTDTARAAAAAALPPRCLLAADGPRCTSPHVQPGSHCSVKARRSTPPTTSTPAVA